MNEVNNYQNSTILIVDDRPENILSLKKILKPLGCVTIEALSGQEAIHHAKHIENIAAILIDVQMPEMDGFQATERILQYNANIPIIFVTALSKEEQYIHKGFEVGAIDYLTKPLDPLIVRSKVKIFLELNQKRQELKGSISALETAQMKLQENNKELEVLATHDHLTGLANRRMFNISLDKAIAYANRHKTLLALLYIDLDNFKSINDTSGHNVGDEILTSVAEKLQKSIRLSDTTVRLSPQKSTTARLGGDEFAIIIEDLSSPADAEAIANKILTSIREPLQINGTEYIVTPSIGVVCMPPSKQTTTSLTQFADIAMYEAKKSGRNTYHVYTINNSKSSKEQELDDLVSQSVINNKLLLYLQPRYQAKSSEIYGIDAIPVLPGDGTNIMPKEFTEAAIRTGNIIPIYEWLIKAGCEKYANLIANNVFPTKSPKLCFNLPIVQLVCGSFYKRLKSILENNKIAPQQIEISITQTSINHKPDYLKEVIQELKEMNISIAYADFGMDYVALKDITSINIDSIKIGHHFLEHINDDPVSQNILKTIITMATKLNLNVIVDSIDSKESAKFLEENNCHFLQGDEYFPATDAKNFAEQLKKRQS